MKNILLVEDSLDERILVKRQMKKIGITEQLTMVSDGQKAVDLLSRLTPEELPMFVLLDIKMPGMNGHQVLQWIRQNKKTKLLPVVMFSSSDDEHDIQFSYSLGANSYVQKQIATNHELQLLTTYWMEINKHSHRKQIHN